MVTAVFVQKLYREDRRICSVCLHKVETKVNCTHIQKMCLKAKLQVIRKSKQSINFPSAI
jgi:hypothetical protein